MLVNEWHILIAGRHLHTWVTCMVIGTSWLAHIELTGWLKHYAVLKRA